VSAEASDTRMILVKGAPGEEAFGKLFSEWVEQWESVGKKGEVAMVTIGDEPVEGREDVDRFKELLAALPEDGEPLWIVLIGHGTFDRRDARFNMVGPDFTAKELDEWLVRFSRKVVIINAASASGPFLDRLSRQGRVVVTATKSGTEVNFARFGGYLAHAISSDEGDLDKDGQTSLLEAYLLASKLTEEFYQSEGRLATEHALIDDNGDAKGTRSEFFQGVRAVKKPKGGASIDGELAHQLHLVLGEFEKAIPSELRAKRDELEKKVFELREKRNQLDEDAYYDQLEELMLQIGKIYAEAERRLQTKGS